MAAPDDFYSPAARQLQDQFDARRLADRVHRLVHHTLTPDDRAFVERQDMFFLATVDANGHPNCSYKGGDPGFVRVLDERTLAFPSYNGNGMYLTLGNLATTEQVGMLFIDFVEQTRLRVNGEAVLSSTDPLLLDYPDAELIVRIEVREVFPNCPRYIHKHALVERSRFVPRTGCVTPAPAWKRAPWAADALPSGDPAADPEREILRRG